MLLIRHAKAEQGATDLDRGLTGRGRRDAAAIGRWLVAHDLTPDHVVTSPAKRAQQTWELAAAELPVAPPSVTDGRIYANTVDELLDVIRSSGMSVQTLALIGHNPSIQELAAGWAAGYARTELLVRFPTGSVAVFVIDSDWPGAGPSGAALSVFHTCRG